MTWCGGRSGAGKTRLYLFDVVNLHTAVEMVHALRQAESEGYDAAVIGQSLDPGLFAAKELLGIPVVGILESATHFASLWGESFGIITIPAPSPYVANKYQQNHRRNIERYGLASKLVAVEQVDMPLDRLTEDIQQGRHDEILTRFTEAARRCRDAGADVVIAGDTIISIIMVHEKMLVLPSGQVVVDLVTSGVKMAETMVDLRRSLGIVRSTSGTYAPPEPQDLQDIASAFDT